MMEHQNTHHDKDSIPKNMVPNQNPKPLPQKDRSIASGNLVNKDSLRRKSEADKNSIKTEAEKKSDNK